MSGRKCPKCEGNISLRLSDFIRRSSENRRCTECGTEFETTNSAALSALNGVIFCTAVIQLGGVIETGWLRLAAAGAACWVIDPIVTLFCAELQKVSYRDNDVVKAQRWSMVASVSGWLFGTAVVVTAMNFFSFFEEMITSLDYIESGGTADLGVRAGGEPLLRVFVGAVLGLAAFAVSAIATVIKNNLRCEGKAEAESEAAETSGANF